MYKCIVGVKKKKKKERKIHKELKVANSVPNTVVTRTDTSGTSSIDTRKKKKTLTLAFFWYHQNQYATLL